MNVSERIKKKIKFVSKIIKVPFIYGFDKIELKQKDI